MKTQISEGEILHFTAPVGGVVSGTGLLVGELFVIPITSADAGVVVAGKLTGEFDHAKATGEAWTPGAGLYFDAANKRLTTTSAGNTKVGKATAAALAAATVGPFVIRQPA